MSSRPNNPIDTIEIAGTRGAAILVASRLELYHEDGSLEVPDGSDCPGGGADPMAFDHGPHRALIGEMLGAIDQNREPSNSAASGLPVQNFIELVLAVRLLS